MGSLEEAARAMGAINSWAACTCTGAGTYPILVRYADTPEEKNRPAVLMHALIMISMPSSAKTIHCNNCHYQHSPKQIMNLPVSLHGLWY